MTPETKKRLAYGLVIVVAGGGGIYLWHRFSVTGGGSASTAAAVAAQAAADADTSNQETQLAELSALGSSGASLSNPSLGETPVEDFGQELASIFQATGLTPPAVTSNAGATPATPPVTTTATGTTGPTAPTGTAKPAQLPATTVLPISSRMPYTENNNEQVTAL